MYATTKTGKKKKLINYNNQKDKRVREKNLGFAGSDIIAKEAFLLTILPLHIKIAQKVRVIKSNYLNLAI